MTHKIETANQSKQCDRRIYSIIEAGQYLGVARSLVYKLIKSKQLPLRKIGGKSMILKADLDAYIDRLPAVEVTHGEN